MTADQLSQPEPTRRRVIEFFLGGGLLASFASFIYPVLRYLVPPAVADLGGDEVVAAKVSELKPNSAMIFRFGSHPGLLIMTSDDTYRALSATCTHLGCTVQYRSDLHEIWCLRHNTVPTHRLSYWYFLGGITLFLFVIQVLTGILLLLYYRPGANEAFESVQYIMTRVRFGWLVRSIHSWSANLMIFTAFAHMFSVLFLKAYRKPRELTWITGVFLLFLVMGFGFSGYLLPWNTLAFFATKVGTEITGQVPVIGTPLMIFLRGGEEVTGATLTR